MPDKTIQTFGQGAQMDPSQFLRIEDVCDDFEAELRAGKRPVIEEYLGRVPEGDRDQLLAKLRGLEGQYLKPAQETVSQQAAPAAVTGVQVVVPGYEIQGELGRGGMGVVYKAWQKSPPPPGGAEDDPVRGARRRGREGAIPEGG